VELVDVLLDEIAIFLPIPFLVLDQILLQVVVVVQIL